MRLVQEMGMSRALGGSTMVVSLLAPMHGPVVRQSVSELLKNYRWVS